MGISPLLNMFKNAWSKPLRHVFILLGNLGPVLSSHHNSPGRVILWIKLTEGRARCPEFRRGRVGEKSNNNFCREIKSVFLETVAPRHLEGIKGQFLSSTVSLCTTGLNKLTFGHGTRLRVYPSE